MPPSTISRSSSIVIESGAGHGRRISARMKGGLHILSNSVPTGYASAGLGLIWISDFDLIPRSKDLAQKQLVGGSPPLLDTLLTTIENPVWTLVSVSLTKQPRPCLTDRSKNINSPIPTPTTVPSKPTMRLVTLTTPIYWMYTTRRRTGEANRQVAC